MPGVVYNIIFGCGIQYVIASLFVILPRSQDRVLESIGTTIEL